MNIQKRFIPVIVGQTLNSPTCKMCGVTVDLKREPDAVDAYGECECRKCTQSRMDFMWNVMLTLQAPVIRN